MAPVRAHAFITGYVQGVFFRDSASRRAASRGVTGWVRNLSDGRVELVAEGEEQAVRDLIDWCYAGPPHATVQDVEVEWADATGEFSGFSAK